MHCRALRSRRKASYRPGAKVTIELLHRRDFNHGNTPEIFKGKPENGHFYGPFKYI
ncbi:hypothetical protein AGR4A_Lc10171 [Agrobacterium tumefaciens str. B6]|uniref:Uncharacterized protein n=2 Tax=Agrobacterium tumefaciens TaxID=358 RepID=A0A822V5Q5_AGRTU|nr:hypothetical protein AGR4C_Lc10128 [Agrobacterium tumefaciens str. Kerr 14]CVI20537.1 hypothetical protein AGR4A_Lc10171 [Agrobacterium tumefaciens str. B6]